MIQLISDCFWKMSVTLNGYTRCYFRLMQVPCLHFKQKGTPLLDGPVYFGGISVCSILRTDVMRETRSGRMSLNFRREKRKYCRSHLFFEKKSRVFARMRFKVTANAGCLNRAALSTVFLNLYSKSPSNQRLSPSYQMRNVIW